MRYRMEKTDKGEGSDPALTVTAWPEPFGYDATPEEQKIREEFAFTEDGIVSGVEWLNGQYKKITGEKQT